MSYVQFSHGIAKITACGTSHRYTLAQNIIPALRLICHAAESKEN